MAALINQNPSFIPGILTPSLTNNPRLCIKRSMSTNLPSASYSSLSHRPLRYAILGAGFAGLSVAWHLLQESSRDLHLAIDIYDEVGIGGGASGVSGGLLHPYSPKVKPLWRAVECWNESLNLLTVAEDAFGSKASTIEKQEGSQNINTSCSIVRRRIESIGEDIVQTLVPNLRVPFNLAFYMPEAINIHPRCYLEGLYLACKNFLKDMAGRGATHKELCLHKKSVDRLLELDGEYDAVIVCLGARAAFLPELAGRLPLRTCRGVIAHLQLDDDTREGYPDHSPSILSDAWLAVWGPRTLQLGSTWEWKSTNYSRNVAAEETSRALEELIPKASAVYPALENWKITGASAGLRGMPPLTPHDSLHMDHFHFWVV